MGFTNLIFMCLFTDLFRSSSYSKWRINHPLSSHRFMDEEAKYLLSEISIQFRPVFVSPTTTPYLHLILYVLHLC